MCDDVENKDTVPRSAEGLRWMTRQETWHPFSASTASGTCSGCVSNSDVGLHAAGVLSLPLPLSFSNLDLNFVLLSMLMGVRQVILILIL